MRGIKEFKDTLSYMSLIDMFKDATFFGKILLLIISPILIIIWAIWLCLCIGSLIGENISKAY